MEMEKNSSAVSNVSTEYYSTGSFISRKSISPLVNNAIP